ncbi:uncharacterized protein Dana_GF17540, isoform B [Drosophila ananassae]|uniref:Uncharacterized protein, isoform A n=1 Tax=Drosophila ananassae TaxID=7217 RepID=B3LW23_DROAN|nr:uncharacterized protein LOC6500324 [Drosophila ananassae]XP_014766504.1 uncharacterized protein LOC6500324 [Drosophila ananassae]XP_032312177.1 uncharacterized protein LOC6500324 [Drosophila ananassae]EDV41556.1 uncharacterized protein Dana_GF17540, isoform A [Drosophila ananassae]KPU79243.1 uncharacterized protein Dana_GF17540, isoform B [Drosophila ananassae]
MSCQQVYRLHSATATATLPRNPASRNRSLAAAASPAASISVTARAGTAATLTPVESIASKTTSEDADPYAFTEAVAVAPPILFNAQKSRARLSDTTSNRSCSSNKRQIAAGAATSGRKVGLVAQRSSAVAAVPQAAPPKAQASLATPASTSTSTTTNFHYATQSQRQPVLPPVHLQLQLSQQTPQLQSQASPKRANVCIVRPQQQQQEKSAEPSEPCQQLTAPPPPLYSHTPSLWQTPLLLDNSQKQQQPVQLIHPQQQHLPQQQQPQPQQTVALVSPPSSPASLPSPTLPPASGAVTAMVAPISVSPKGSGLPLPPSKFHHTTLAQHLQKVECLKKKKSLPLVCQINNNNNIKLQNNNSIGESLNKSVAYNYTQPPPLTVFKASAPSQPAVPSQKHSAGKNLEESDLSDIPVNVIFRKPKVAGTADAEITVGGVKLVTPLTPPTPPEIKTPPPLLAQLHPQIPPPACAPSSLQKPAVPTPLAPAITPTSAKKSEQMSSKVANRKGNTNTHNNRQAAKKVMPPPQEPATSLTSKTEEPTTRQRRPTSGSKPVSVALIENQNFPTDSPYCLQQYWMHSSGLNYSKDVSADTPLSPSNKREERIAVKKGILRRQALQLLSTRSLQELPLRAAKQRLQSVQTLLVKYQDHAAQQQGIGIGNRCLVANCKLPTLSMAAHCERHIVNNDTQQLFQPCVAWRVDGTACQAPVFDVLHTLALCKVHSHLRTGLDAARPAPRLSVPSAGVGVACSAAGNVGATQRKRKANSSPVTRPQKRGRKPLAEQFVPQLQSHTLQANTLPLIPSSGMQRKSSTTSLESIASNSHSSHSTVASVQNMPQLSIPPALVPLSGDFHAKQQQQQQEQEQQVVPKLEIFDPVFKFVDQNQLSSGVPVDSSLNLLANANIKAEEISQIVAQLAAAGGDLHHHNNNNNNNISNQNNNSVHFNNNNMNFTNSNSQQHLSFPSFSTAFGSAMGQPIIPQNGHATPSAGLANTADILGQEMLSICENSSAYASSEDTGLGGLSESELIGANDADDIALVANGAHLLEEHDLVNVFDTLPDDAFNELFESVQQAECEAMDRALEIADKNLKCLQQTIGGSADSAFLNDFLDVGDDLLADAVMHSPNTSGIDASTLFVDSSSGGGNSSSNGGSDISRLVQT